MTFPTLHAHTTSPTLHAHTTFPTLHAHTTFPTLHAHTTFPTPHAHTTFPTLHAHMTFPTLHAHTTFPTLHAHTTFPTLHAHTTFPTLHAHTTSPTLHAHTTSTTLHAHTTFPTLHAHTTFPTLHAHTTFPTPHFTKTLPTPTYGTHPSPPTPIPINQAPTTNVSQSSPTKGPPTRPQASPPELCPSDQDEYPLKVIYKKSRRFSRYNHNNQHKERPNKVKNKDHCVNLSSCTLTKEETSILSKGLGFVPTPPTPHPSTIQKDINKFARTLRLKFEFQQNRPKKKRFKLRSNYIPPISTSGCFEDYIYALKIEATKLKPRKTRNNLSQHQQIALRKLRKLKDIIIKKADKGSTVVIQDRQEYIDTGLEHLSNKNTYSELEEDQTKQVAEEVTQTVRAMYQEGHIDNPLLSTSYLHQW